MKQALIKKGVVVADEITEPQLQPSYIKIKTLFSCISAGTEMSAVSSSGGNLMKKAMDKPEQVKQVLNKLKTDGALNTFKKVNEKLQQPIASGYSISGIVDEVGYGIKDLKPGDKVAAAGAGYAMHAEYVVVPRNLVMKCPDSLSLKDASTVTLGGIALHGVRRANMKLGEQCVVFGSGILGLISLQLLRASGARVIVIDINNERLSIAKALGAEVVINSLEEDAISKVKRITYGHGADAVLFTASTKSSEPLSSAFKMTRKKGAVILVGVSGMTINREDIYKSEIDFMISTSYGVGRYDSDYEEKGMAYPYAHIRWTENRNMEEYLRLLSTGQVSVETLISASFTIDHVTEAYLSLKQDPSNIIVLLEYPNQKTKPLEKIVFSNSRRIKKDIINIGFIGCGSFLTAMHLPNIAKLKNKFRVKAIANRNGVKAKFIAERYGADFVTSDVNNLLKDGDIDLIFISTQHDSHSQIALESLKANKAVFVEKPLATTIEDLNKIDEFIRSTKKPPLLMVGFNRRFSPMVREIKKKIVNRTSPLKLNYSINAGCISDDHWVYDQGGRIIGEGCHFIDTVSYLVDDEIESIMPHAMTFKCGVYKPQDNVSFSIKYKDGSVATIQYFSLGSPQLEKERLEVHFDGKSILLSDYKILSGYDINLKSFNYKAPQKGQLEELNFLYSALTEGENWPISYKSMYETTKASILIANSI